MITTRCRIKAWGWDPLIWPAAITLLLIMFLRIRTYLTGQDPFIYIGLARDLLGTPVGSDGFVRALFRVAPGYPIILAGTIQLFGDIAPYWVNLVFGVVFLIFYCQWLRTLFDDPSRRLLVVLGSMAMLWGGYGLNPHFLLYPFRELPAYTLVIVGYFVLEKATVVHDEPRGWSVLFAGMLLFASALVREPMAIAWAGGLGFLCQKQARAVYPYLFSACVLIGVGAIIYVGFGRVTSVHVIQVWQQMMGSSTSADWSSMSSTAVVMGTQLAQEMRWLGIIFLPIGLWRLRRDPRSWWLLFFPALVLFVFYSWIGVHRRYVISILFFLSPLVMSGVVTTVEWSCRRLQRRQRTGLEHSVFSAVSVLLFLFILGFAMQLRPWGPYVGRSEIDSFIRTLARVMAPGDLVYTEGACRYLGDGLISYTDYLPGGHPHGIDVALSRGQRCYFLKPLNKEAFYEPIQNQFPVAAESLIRHRWDLLPVSTPDGEFETVKIGGGQFAVFRIQPWSHTRVRKSFVSYPGTKAVCWLDLGDAGSRVHGTVHILDEEGRQLLDEVWAPGPMIRAIVISGHLVTSDCLVLVFEASEQISSNPILQVTYRDEPITFGLGYVRRPSVAQWFRPPFPNLGTQPKHITMTFEGGTLCLPPILGPAQDLDVLLAAEARGGTASTSTLTIEQNQNRLTCLSSGLGSGKRHWSFQIRPLPSEDPICLKLAAQAMGGGHLRFKQIRIWLKDRVESCPLGK